MSLRTRLIAVLLALAAAGMLVLGAVTYATQRSYQQERIDDQTRAAEPAVGHALDEQLGLSPRDFDRGGDGGRGDPAAANLPPGTYGERRDLSGRLIGEPIVLSYGEEALPAPDLPERLTAGRLFTADAKGDNSLRYRVRTIASPRAGAITVVAIPLNGVEATLNRLLLVEALVILGVLALLAISASFLVRVGLRPLERIGDTAGAIAAGDLSRRVEEASPRTEVGRLGQSLNAMLERLEQAFAQREASEQKLRQFLSDASHELRTPLTSIRGYAELSRMGAATSPEDSEKAMRRIEEEAARMGVLVEDLLILARLDETRAVVREPVDLAALLEDAAADARASDPARAISAAVGDDAFVQGDERQLRQVLGNLVGNALAHTNAAIELSVRRENGDVVARVRDHGPGLPPGDPEQLFSRFWRAERGRERGRAGAGLGLAIVHAIVGAHGGSVSAADAAGGGAEFTVRLPAA